MEDNNPTGNTGYCVNVNLDDLIKDDYLVTDNGKQDGNVPTDNGNNEPEIFGMYFHLKNINDNDFMSSSSTSIVEGNNVIDKIEMTSDTVPTKNST